MRKRVCRSVRQSNGPKKKKFSRAASGRTAKSGVPSRSTALRSVSAKRSVQPRTDGCTCTRANRAARYDSVSCALSDKAANCKQLFLQFVHHLPVFVARALLFYLPHVLTEELIPIPCSKPTPAQSLWFVLYIRGTAPFLNPPPTGESGRSSVVQKM